MWASPIKTLAKDLGKKEGFQNFHSLHLLVHYVEGGKILAHNFGPWPQTNLALHFWIPLSLMNTIMNELYALCLVIYAHMLCMEYVSVEFVFWKSSGQRSKPIKGHLAGPGRRLLLSYTPRPNGPIPFSYGSSFTVHKS